jgi:YVTN family beta-propeller protein
VATGSYPVSVTVDPSGKFVYAANEYSDTISVYTIDQNSGALTAGTSVATGSYPVSVTVDQSGKFVYTANLTSSNISVFAINQNTGALTPVTTESAGTAGVGPQSVTTTTVNVSYVSP